MYRVSYLVFEAAVGYCGGGAEWRLMTPPYSADAGGGVDVTTGLCRDTSANNRYRVVTGSYWVFLLVGAYRGGPGWR